MKITYDSVVLKLKLIKRIINKEPIKIVCNDPKFIELLEKTKQYNSKNEYSSYQALYRIYNNFINVGFRSLINIQGMYGMKKQSKASKQKENIKKWENFIDNLNESQAKDILKLISMISDEPPNEQEIYTVIDQYRKDKRKAKLPMKDICYFFNISKATFYRRLKPKKIIDKRVRDDKQEIVALILNIYNENNTFGINRIWIILKTKYQIKISRKTVKKYMNELKISSIIRRKSKRRIDCKNTKVIISNLLDRNFKISPENKSCCTDVTYIKWRNKFIYLSATISLKDNTIIGWSTSLRNDLELVLNSFKNINLKEFDIVHSDHGVQYSSKEFQKLLMLNNVKQSMSRIGNSLDNRPIEYWFSILKSEKLNLMNVDRLSFEEVNNVINEFIDFYNNKRIQPSLNGQTPCEYKQSLQSNSLIIGV